MNYSLENLRVAPLNTGGPLRTLSHGRLRVMIIV